MLRKIQIEVVTIQDQQIMVTMATINQEIIARVGLLTIAILSVMAAMTMTLSSLLLQHCAFISRT